jgi:hypothetical protein
MRARIVDQILYLHAQDVPIYKKTGSIVRNSYFWALRSIAAQSRRERDWEYDAEVWQALQRMLLSFTESGYLRLSETQLEFPLDQGEIPAVLRSVATWANPEPSPETELEAELDADLGSDLGVDGGAAEFECDEFAQGQPASRGWGRGLSGGGKTRLRRGGY